MRIAAYAPTQPSLTLLAKPAAVQESVGEFRRRPESEPFFRLAKTAKSRFIGIGFIVDTAGCSQAEKGPLEARSSSQTGS